MTSLPRALALSVGQLGDPAILKVIAKSLAVTLAIFAALGGLLWWALDAAIEQWIVANLPADYSGAVAGIVAISVGVIAAWLLFRIVALFVLQFFADDIVRAVEAKHYPHAATVAGLPFRQELSNSLRSALRALLVNIVILPFALVLLFTGVGTALLFWLANAVLLGRELQDMVWLRHRQATGLQAAEETAPIGGVARLVLGGLVAALLAVPFVNFLAPVLGAASATHLVHRGKPDHA